MPIIETANGPVNFCVLIPSRGRAALLAKTLKKMPWLNTPDTYIGVEFKEASEYQFVLGAGAHLIKYTNPYGSVARARESLRTYATTIAGTMLVRPYTHFVITDDNAVHKSEEGLHNLVRACAEWRTPCIMAGMHNTAAHFDRTKIAFGSKRNGLRSYPTVAAIFYCVPREFYAEYSHPEDAYGLDDRHFFLWLLSRGHTEFRVCMDAPFTKSRYQQGGQGSLDERAEKCGRAIARLGSDFPALVGSTGTLRLPWSHLIQTVRQGGHITGNRLTGGAMRKEGSIQTRLTLKRKRR